MRDAEVPLSCELCGLPAEYADSVPDASKPGMHAGECGYRLKPLCWLHAVERRQVATSRVEEIVRCEREGIGGSTAAGAEAVASARIAAGCSTITGQTANSAS